MQECCKDIQEKEEIALVQFIAAGEFLKSKKGSSFLEGFAETYDSNAFYMLLL